LSLEFPAFALRREVQSLSTMLNFKVKAVYEYSSPHEDDLNFPAGQIITVTEEEGDDWYVGGYIDASGNKKDGLFPRNFVEKYEPEPPPRPNRASRFRPMEQPAALAATASLSSETSKQEAAPAAQQEPEQEPEPPKPQPAPIEVPPAANTHLSPTSPTSATSIRPQELPKEQPPAPQPTPAEPAAAPAKKAPPPVATKPSSFRDRIAAFNQTKAAPIAPFKPSGAAPSFIKKPFVAPPPSRNAYVPPVREQPQVKTYRREEDPEIAERHAQNQENAERAGLTSAGTKASNEGEEDQPKPTSLKERIALLQRQQQEQSQRAAGIQKEKPKKPPIKPRTESHLGRAPEGEGAALEQVTSLDSARERGSMDSARPPRSSHGVKSPDVMSPNRELLSDANDADQSGAGDTEDAEGSSTSVEEDMERVKHVTQSVRAPAAPMQEPDVGDEEGAADEPEEEEEEDEMDAETRRKLELRERMAKMSGGMGMPGMFGGLSMGALPPKKKKPVEKKSTGDSEDYPVPQQRVAMFQMPGMPPPVRSPVVEGEQLAVEKEEETPPATHGRDAEDVPDVEDVIPQTIQRTPTGERSPPPLPTDRKYLIPRVPVGGFVRENLDRFQFSASETLSKTYAAFDGKSEYVMTVSVSSMLYCRRFAKIWPACACRRFAHTV
jgi:hypothetical protein